VTLDRFAPGDEFFQSLPRALRLGEGSRLAVGTFAVGRGEDG
jgi:hypothetical protein